MENMPIEKEVRFKAVVFDFGGIIILS